MLPALFLAFELHYRPPDILCYITTSRKKTQEKRGMNEAE
jgi:hypothetical protein